MRDDTDALSHQYAPVISSTPFIVYERPSVGSANVVPIDKGYAQDAA